MSDDTRRRLEDAGAAAGAADSTRRSPTPSRRGCSRSAASRPSVAATAPPSRAAWPGSRRRWRSHAGRRRAGIALVVAGTWPPAARASSRPRSSPQPVNVEVALADGTTLEDPDGLRLPEGAVITVGDGGSARIGETVLRPGDVATVERRRRASSSTGQPWAASVTDPRRGQRRRARRRGLARAGSATPRPTRAPTPRPRRPTPRPTRPRPRPRPPRRTPPEDAGPDARRGRPRRRPPRRPPRRSDHRDRPAAAPRPAHRTARASRSVDARPSRRVLRADRDRLARRPRARTPSIPASRVLRRVRPRRRSPRCGSACPPAWTRSGSWSSPCAGRLGARRSRIVTITIPGDTQGSSTSPEATARPTPTPVPTPTPSSGP